MIDDDEQQNPTVLSKLNADRYYWKPFILYLDSAQWNKRKFRRNNCGKSLVPIFDGLVADQCHFAHQAKEVKHLT